MGTTGGGNDIDISGSSTQEETITSDTTATDYGCITTCYPNRTRTQDPSPSAGDWVIFEDIGAGTEDFHLQDNVAENDAQDNGQDLSTSFSSDIDGGLRTAPWDIGADDIGATTAVSLVSFAAQAFDGAAELTWETGSEIDNLGFHLYRSTTEEGPYERITSNVIPGLGSSPEGARYSYVDSGLMNGVTYYYKLEDIETTGATELHGPVSATPTTETPAETGEGGEGGEGGEVGEVGEVEESSGPEEPRPRITYGIPGRTKYASDLWARRVWSSRSLRKASTHIRKKTVPCASRLPGWS